MLLNRPWPPTAETGQQKERMRQIHPPDASSFIATSAILRSRAAPAPRMHLNLLLLWATLYALWLKNGQQSNSNKGEVHMK